MSSFPATRLYAIISAPRYYSVQPQQQPIIRSNTFKDKKFLYQKATWSIFS